MVGFYHGFSGAVLEGHTVANRVILELVDSEYAYARSAETDFVGCWKWMLGLLRMGQVL